MNKLRSKESSNLANQQTHQRLQKGEDQGIGRVENAIPSLAARKWIPILEFVILLSLVRR